MDNPENLLPIEVVRELLYHVPDLVTVVNLYNSTPQARMLLDCRDFHPISTTDRFVGNTDCATSVIQQNLLTHINVKFNLKLITVDWGHIYRAYVLSGANPRCDDCTSIYACLKSAVKLRLSDRVDMLYAIWKQRLQDYNVRNDRQSGNSIPEILADLTIIAYKHQHLELGNKLYAELIVEDEHAYLRNLKLIYFRLKAWVRFILKPYKVKKTRDIRQEYYTTLYDPSVDLETKQCIWRSKYDFVTNNQSLKITRRGMELNAPVEAVKAALAKIGIYSITSETELQRPQAEVLYLFSLYSGNLQFVPRTWGNKLQIISTIIKLKLGYFDSELRNLSTYTVIRDISGENVSIAKFLCRFTLPQLEVLDRGLDKYNGLDDDGDSVLTTIAYAGTDDLYSQYKAKYAIDYRQVAIDIFASGFSANLGNLEIINDTLATLISNLNPGNRIYTRDILQNWVNENSTLFVKIWQRYGRRQFEDSLMYLRMHFDVYLDINRGTFISDLFAEINRQSAEGLLAYIFGLRLNKERKLTPLMGVGVVRLPVSFFTERAVFLEGGIESLLESGKIGIVQTLLNIKKYYQDRN